VFWIQQPFEDFGVGVSGGSLVSASIRILVVDDLEAWRQRICSILQTRPELCVVAEAADGLEAVEKAQALKPDLILLDIGLPSLNGIEAAHRISRLLPTATILFVSQISDADVVQEALRNGAKGYVWKQDAGIDLLLAVDTALRGAHFVSSGIKADDSDEIE
jgi:DNA-binding NarL/FixJ family response regulator